MRRNKNTAYSKRIEIILKAKYAKLCSKIGRRNGDGKLSESDESDDESLDIYDCFSGDASVGNMELRED